MTSPNVCAVGADCTFCIPGDVPRGAPAYYEAKLACFHDFTAWQL